MKVKKETQYKLFMTLGWIIFVALLLLFVFSDDNFELLKSLFFGELSEAELSDRLRSFGWHGYITVTVLSALQVVCACLPAEPIQVLGGLTFGFPVGLLLCWLGVFLGNTVIYLLYRSCGDKLSDFFVKKLHLNLDAIARSGKCVFIVFVLYFLPAIPYGMICFFAASTGMRYRRYITVTMLGALPSVCIGVGLGYVTFASNWITAVCIFTVLVALLVVMALKKDVLFSKLNDYADKQKNGSQNGLQKTNGFVLGVVYFALRFYYRICGVRIKSTNKIGEPKGPAVILCNHGSFIDFIFGAAMLRKYKPNFIMARLYFYDNRLAWLVRTIGGFPKSMFAMDIESTKNSRRVLKNGGILTMMPEARLSTTGRFEDIQDSTYSFLKKSAVSVYTLKFGGDYFADPKWGKGFRRGAVVEGELDILYTAEQIAELSVEEIKKGVEKRLYYNEFEWIKERPHLRYREKRMAEGLENILTVCPTCGQKYSLKTERDKIFCESCGYLTSLDERYLFTGDFRFRDLTQWYDWQKELLRKEILADENYVLSTEVELRLPGTGRGLTRHGGNGICRLSRDGLTYCGSKDGESVELHFTLERIYRLLFGAGENFEIYNGSEILYFVPAEKRSAVDWYLASMILHDEFT